MASSEPIPREVRRRLDQDREDILALYEITADTNKKVGVLSQQVSALDAKVDHLGTRFDGLETRFDGLETRVDEQFAELRGMLGQVLQRLPEQDR